MSDIDVERRAMERGRAPKAYLMHPRHQAQMAKYEQALRAMGIHVMFSPNCPDDKAYGFPKYLLGEETE